VREAVGAAYACGARHVSVELVDPLVNRLRIENSEPEHLRFVPNFERVKYLDLVKEKAAVLKIVGSEEPDALEDLDPEKVNTIRLNRHLAIKEFYDEGIDKSLVHWCVAAASTPKWGVQVFPGLDSKTANRKLWNQLFKICGVDSADYLDKWNRKSAALKQRAEKLNSMGIKELLFKGPDTDLKVGLSDRALFKGGPEMGPYGVEFEPNIPTEEVFTTPDFRVTSGTARVTRPVMVNGVIVRDLVVRFEDGQLVDFTAKSGEAAFKAYIDSDEGGRRLGEVALVGVDSPIYRSGLMYHEILLDENAACHIAVGSGYKFCIEGGDSLSTEEALEIGCNESTVHTDLMISSENVDVVAVVEDGQQVALLKGGAWCAGW
jgi:aminopeptidase